MDAVPHAERPAPAARPGLPRRRHHGRPGVDAARPHAGLLRPGVPVQRRRGGCDGGREQPLVAPTLFWLLPGVEHGYGPDAGGWNEWWALFDGPGARACQDLGYVPRDEPVIPVADAAGLEVAFGALARACRPDDPSTDVLAAAAMHLLILATRRAAIPDPVADRVLATCCATPACPSPSPRTPARSG